MARRRRRKRADRKVYYGAPTEDPGLRWDDQEVPEPKENDPDEETEAPVTGKS